MEKFNSGKWIKAFKAHNIVEKDESIKLKDLLHTDKVDGEKPDKVDIKIGAENDLAIEKDKKGRDVYAVGLTEAPVSVDHTTMRLKSNIDQKWSTTEIMEDDLRQWMENIVNASGQQLAIEVSNTLHTMLDLFDKDVKEMGDEDYEPGRPSGAADRFQ